MEQADRVGSDRVGLSRVDSERADAGRAGSERADAERIEAALLAHPSVARLGGGYASYLPGKRVVGVRAEERVGVSVVLHPDRPIPEVVAELRDVVAKVAGTVPVDIEVADLETP